MTYRHRYLSCIGIDIYHVSLSCIGIDITYRHRHLSRICIDMTYLWRICIDMTYNLYERRSVTMSRPSFKSIGIQILCLCLPSTCSHKGIQILCLCLPYRYFVSAYLLQILCLCLPSTSKVSKSIDARLHRERLQMQTHQPPLAFSL